MAKKYKKVVFKITYIGDNPPTLEDVERILLQGDLDDMGIIKIKKLKK